ncbi:MAG: DsbA family protein [Halobacteriovoraceae bacterium]|nr:DsbA family protein [Halobacteriovoraceae bacterium]
MKPILYFDFISPFSFLLWEGMKNRNLTRDFEYKPVMLAKILNHWGQKPPAEIEPKQLYLFKSCLRYAKKNNIELLAPKSHPFNSLYALRLATSQLHDNNYDSQIRLIDTLWEMTWKKRIEMGNPDIIVKELQMRGFENAPQLMDLTYHRDVKNQLKKNTAEAIENGVFGVPSLFLNGEIFWGNDSLEDFLLFQAGEDLLDHHLFENIKDTTTRKTSRFHEDKEQDHA